MREERKGPTRRLKDLRVHRQILGRKEKSTSKWWFDPTKLIPIVISRVALFLSYLSWQESYRNRLINEETNRPILSFVDLISTRTQLPSLQSEGTVPIMFVIKVKNFGKVSARVDQLILRHYVHSAPDKCELKVHSGLPYGQSTQTILPGMKETFLGYILMPRTCDQLSELGLSLMMDF